jgi:hypothetical protein
MKVKEILVILELFLYFCTNVLGQSGRLTRYGRYARVGDKNVAGERGPIWDMGHTWARDGNNQEFCDVI